MPNNTALITGASAGIGLELAQQFASHGHDLILVARRKTQLNGLAKSLRRDHGITCQVIPLDLTADGACQSLYKQVQDSETDIEILVNNAGVLRSGAFRHSKLDDVDAMIELNIAVPTRLCRLFLGAMVQRGSGRIMNVASIAAFQPVPSLAVYAATKAYLLSFTDALTIELKGKGVTATALCPGFTDTDMLRDAEGQSAIPTILVMPADQVARAGYDACMKGKPILVPGVTNNVATTSARLLPRWLVRSASAFALRGGSRRTGD